MGPELDVSKADFSGYATKAGLKCSDGRTIMPDAFKHQDTVTVPLVWAHDHSGPENVLGKAILEHRDSSHPEGAGTYCYGFFNETVKGQSSKQLVQHGDVTWLSIFANQLVEKSKQVFHGAIREVSLVLAGANPGAKIMQVALQHGDGEETVLEDEAIITTGIAIHSATDSSESTGGTQDGVISHATKGRTVQDVYDTLDEDQRELVHYMIGEALEASGDSPGTAAHSATDTSGDNTDGTDNGDADGSTDNGESTDEGEGSGDAGASSAEGTSGASGSSESGSAEGTDDGSGSGAGSSDNNAEGDLAHQEGNDNMSRNAFDKGATGGTKVDTSKRLTHDQLVEIVKHGRQVNSFKEAVLAHADEYGITDIDLLFPDARNITQTPQWIARRQEWVAKVLDGVKHSPFAKVRTLLADITEPEARAKGYIKGTKKKEEVFKLLKRTTGPTTVYKKQKLDRDDVLDITDMDVIAWLKAEMRLMLEEEIARAILVGDGRSAMDDDKISDPEGAASGDGIRSILHDDDLYSIKYQLAANVSPKDAVKGLVRARSKYRGTGKPTLFVSDSYLTDIMLEEDKFGRPLYESEATLADKLRVAEIVTVDLFDDTADLFAIMVSLADYTVGTNAGGELTNFEDFDIDFNQNKYLQETRLSGGLTRPFSAVVVTRAQGALAVAEAPSYNGATQEITIPADVEGVSYFDTTTDEEMTGVVHITGATEVEARPEAGYYLAPNTTDSWTFTP